MKYRFESFFNEDVNRLACLLKCQAAIVSASWEHRSQACLSLLEQVKIDKLIVIRFPNHGKTGMSGSIRQKYRHFCKKNSILYQEVLFDSTSKDYASLVESAKQVDLAVSSYKNVLLDISSTPRLLWASLVGLWHRSNKMRLLTFIYARPTYTFRENPNRELIYDYTQGDWQLCDPAFFPTNHSGGLFKSNILSIGYEYDHIKKLIYRMEAEDNIFVYAKPGFQNEYTNIAEATVQKIKNVFEISDNRFIAHQINDLRGLCERLDGLIAALAGRKGGSVMLVCAGSKIHSLAFVFTALRNSAISIKIRVPAHYNEVSTEWAGTMEAFCVENLFSPI